VVIHLGTNGGISARQFEALLRGLADVRLVVVVNVKVPRPWEAANNQIFASSVPRFPNAVLVDWHGASRGRGELFVRDGIHLQPAGARFYAGLIASAIQAGIGTAGGVERPR
jgi:hypothetical protein